MDVIGMTNLQEAKLAREAEICYVTIAMVTDYDCWHPDHDAVTVNDIIANLMKNAENACKVVRGGGEPHARGARVQVRLRAFPRHHHGPQAGAGSHAAETGTDCWQVLLSDLLACCLRGERPPAALVAAAAAGTELFGVVRGARGPLRARAVRRLRGRDGGGGGVGGAGPRRGGSGGALPARAPAAQSAGGATARRGALPRYAGRGRGRHQCPARRGEAPLPARGNPARRSRARTMSCSPPIRASATCRFPIRAVRCGSGWRRGRNCGGRLKARARWWWIPIPASLSSACCRCAPKRITTSSRAAAYGGEGGEALPELARRWCAETFGVPGAAPYIAVPGGGERAEIAVSLGVGGNAAKRVADPFEARLLERLAATGASVCVDRGGGGEEAARVERAAAGLPSRAAVGGLLRRFRGHHRWQPALTWATIRRASTWRPLAASRWSASLPDSPRRACSTAGGQRGRGGSISCGWRIGTPSSSWPRYLPSNLPPAMRPRPHCRVIGDKIIGDFIT